MPRRARSQPSKAPLPAVQPTVPSRTYPEPERRRRPAWKWDPRTAFERAEHLRARIAMPHQADVITDAALALTSPEYLRPDTGEDPVMYARRIAAAYAPADMQLLVGLTHGTNAADLSRHTNIVRLLSELATRRLAMVGIRSGDAPASSASEALAVFLARWQSAEPEPEVEAIPGELVAPEPPEPQSSPHP